MKRYPSLFHSLFFAAVLLPCLSSVAYGSTGDLNCDGTSDVTDVQIMIHKALKSPLSPVIDADQNGIHDDCPDAPCGPGTLVDSLTGTCVVDPSGLQAAKDEAFAQGVASVDITADNQDSFDAGVASVDMTILDLSGVNLTGTDFSDSDLSHWEFGRAIINYADMSNTLLVEADLSDVELKNTNFTGADLTNAVMGGTDLTGATWTDATCPDGTEANDNGGTCCEHLNGATPFQGCP